MRFRSICKKAVPVAAGFLVSGTKAFCADEGKITLVQALQEVKNVFNSEVVILIKDIATGIVFVIGIVLVVWGYAGRNKNGGDNDKMLNAGIYALVAVAMIEIFSALAR